jgi:uncharacterized phage-associated protein
MFFRLDTRKAIEATATLLRLVPRHVMDRKRLLALLYLADRESLTRTGRPIIGGRLVALDYGPIHSEVYDFIKGGRHDQADWSTHFDNVEIYRVHLHRDVGVAALSEDEIDLLNEISEKHAHLDTWELANVTHRFKEYADTYQENTSSPITLEKIIDAVGRSKQKAIILRDAEERAAYAKLFAPKAPRQ